MPASSPCCEVVVAVAEGTRLPDLGDDLYSGRIQVVPAARDSTSPGPLRNLAVGHPYDAHNDGQMSLRGNTVEVAEQLKGEIQARLEKAGVEVMESRISHMAYAPEIANAMLRRQQASAVIAARSKIVEGAVSMVEMALENLSARQVVTLDDERKAAMVSNLLVVLCSDRHTQPVVNTGSLYQ